MRDSGAKVRALFRGFCITVPFLVTAVCFVDLQAFQSGAAKGGASKAPAAKSATTSKAPAAAKAPAPKLGDSKINPKDGNRYLYIPPGKFTEGCSPEDEDC